MVNSVRLVAFGLGSVIENFGAGDGNRTRIASLEEARLNNPFQEVVQVLPLYSYTEIRRFPSVVYNYFKPQIILKILINGGAK